MKAFELPKWLIEVDRRASSFWNEYTLEETLPILLFFDSLSNHKDKDLWKKLINSFGYFSLLCSKNVLPVNPKAYSVDFISNLYNKADTKLQNDLKESWLFLRNFLKYCVYEGFTKEPSLRVLWLSTHLWRGYTSEKAIEEASVFLAYIRNVIGDALRLNIARTCLFMLVRSATCRPIKELYKWPLEKLPTHPCQHYKIDENLKMLLRKWQRLMLTYYNNVENEENLKELSRKYLFPRLIDGEKMSAPTNWFFSLRYTASLTPTLSIKNHIRMPGALAIAYAVQEDIFKDVIHALDRSLFSTINILININ